MCMFIWSYLVAGFSHPPETVTLVIMIDGWVTCFSTSKHTWNHQPLMITGYKTGNNAVLTCFNHHIHPYPTSMNHHISLLKQDVWNVVEFSLSWRQNWASWKNSSAFPTSPHLIHTSCGLAWRIPRDEQKAELVTVGNWPLYVHSTEKLSFICCLILNSRARKP
jgi:hypothetical protein